MWSKLSAVAEKSRIRPSISHLLKLLKNRAFRRDALQVIKKTTQEAARLRLPPRRVQTKEAILNYLKHLNSAHRQAVENFLKRRVSFRHKWGVYPPMSLELVSPRSRAEIAAFSGRWGVIPVFAWTKKADVLAAFARITRPSVIGKRYRSINSIRRPQLTLWLREHRVRPKEIKRHVYKLPVEGIDLPDDELEKLFRKHEARLWKKLGREPTPEEVKRMRHRRLADTAIVRVGWRRYVEFQKALRADMRRPRMRDPIGHLLTMLLRAASDSRDKRVRRLSIALRKSIVSPQA